MTVVIPTWNRRELVQEAVASVIAQTYPHWELIVVDDGSTDGTVERLQAVGEPRLRVIPSAHIGNAARMRNIGAAAGTGEWIAFLDSDDLWLPDKLDRQLKALAHGGADWCYADCNLVDEEGRTFPRRAGAFRPCSGWIIAPLLLDQTGAFVGSLLVRRSVFEAIGGFDPEMFPDYEDLEFEFRLALTAPAAAVDDALVLVREHPGRRTDDLTFPHERVARVYQRFIDRHPPPGLARIARRMQARHLADAAAGRLSRRQIGRGGRLLARSLLLGVDPVPWLRASVRGVRGLIRER